MVKKEYLQLTVEELIEDHEFSAWVLRGKNQKEWESFLKENPEFRHTVKNARKIIELLSDHPDHLREDDIFKIWKNIKSYDDKIRTPAPEIKLHSYLRYAAVLIVALTIGAAGYWIICEYQKQYVFSTTYDPEKNCQSHLLLSDGTTVNLKKENSKIELNADQQVIIDNEQVIDLSKNSNSGESQMNEVVIPFGKKSQLILEDSTKVWLNAGSRMAFPTRFSDKKREVFLEGEAYFEVTRNKSLPFIVNTSNISVKVLGTRFNLSAYKSDQLVETVLIEGKVVVCERSDLGFLKGETILAPDQKASYDKEHRTLSVKSEPDVEFAMAWTEGWFKFSQQNLDVVLKKLQRYYNVQFVFGCELPTSDMITGKLDLKESVEQVMVALADVANIRFRIDGEKIYISGKNN